MRGSARAASIKNQANQQQYQQQNQNANQYFNAQYINPSGQHFNQSVVNTSGINGASQFVHQVIYNQGSVVINNPSTAPTITVPGQSHDKGQKVYQFKNQETHIRQQSVVHQPGGNSSSHQKKQSNGFNDNYIISQDSVSGLNYKDAQQSHVRQVSNAKQSIPQATTNVNQGQPPGSAQPAGHKKSQSMAQTKISQLLSMGAKKNLNLGKPAQSINFMEIEDSEPADLNDILNRSMDNINQFKRQAPNSKGNQEEQELMRVLHDQKNLNELSYQNNNEYTACSKEGGSFSQFMNKHVRAATQGTSTLPTQPNVAKASASYHIQSNSNQVRPPSSKINKQDLLKQIKPSSGRGTEKIASSGKVFASGAVVKKPNHKLVQVQQTLVPSQQVPVQSTAQHHRIKSDTHYSLKNKEINGGIASTAIQHQKGKVGKILKNNFVDSANAMVSSVASHQDVSLNSSGVAHSSFLVAAQQQQKNHRTFQQPASQITQQQTSNQQLIAQLMQAQINNQAKKQIIQNAAQPKKKQSSKEKKPIHSNQVSVQNIPKDRQTELQELYTKLLKKQSKVPDNSAQIDSQASLAKQQIKQQKKYQQAAQQILNVVGNSDERKLQNYRFLQQKTVDARGSSWDGKITNQNSALNLQQIDQLQNQAKVPPQSSSSSLRTSQAALYNQQNFNVINARPNQKVKKYENTKEPSKFQIVQTNVKESTPISNQKTYLNIEETKNYSQSKSMTMRESSIKNTNVQKLLQQVSNDDLNAENGKQINRRSLSNGSNDSAKFKFNKSVNGIPVFTAQQPQTQQPQIVNNVVPSHVKSKTVHISRQSLSSRDTSQGKPKPQQQMVYQQSPQIVTNSCERRYQNSPPKSPTDPTHQQIAQSRQSVKMRPKSKSTHQSKDLKTSSLSGQGITQISQNNNKFRIQTITACSNNASHQSPNISKQAHPTLCSKIRNRDKESSQNMVILENTPPDTLPAATQLSDWDRLIKQQLKNGAMINNLVNDESNVTRPGHIKNKNSTKSDCINSSVQINNQAFKQIISDNSQPNLEIKKYSHKRAVKSDVPANIKGLINNSLNLESQELPQNNVCVPAVQKQGKEKYFNKEKNNFIRNRLEANPVDDKKQYNISIEKFDFDDNQSIEIPIKGQNAAAKAQRPSSQHKQVSGQDVNKQKQILQSSHNRQASDVIAQKKQIFQSNMENNQQEKQQQQHQQPPQKQVQKQGQAPMHQKPLMVQVSQEFAAPQNSAQLSAVVSPDRAKLGGDWRIETMESLDSNMAPQEKTHCKLVHHIKKSYETKNECPVTTVEFYRVGKVLGKGAFGKVNIAQQLVAKQLVAIKSINTTHFKEESQSKKVMQEVMILKQTRHKNIIRLYEYFQTQKHVLIVIELSSGGDLLSYVRKRRQLKEEVAKSVFKQIIEALKYCHSKRILHRDIKLDNILLSVDGGVKICDFGVSKIVKPGERMTEQCGTPAYIAPEILVDNGYEGFTIDIWSAGVVLYAMLYGTVPFKANNMTELQKMIIKANYTLAEGISKEARDLLNQLLEKDPKTRITIPGILAHPWMRDAKESVDLFTNAEKNYMIGQLINQDATLPQNSNNNDFFSDQMLESSNSIKNAETKSIILAPFNSTRSNLKEIEKHYSLPDEIKELIQSKSCLKFAQRVREIDKQYEVNNNAELDNGVYHEFNVVEKEDSLESDFRESMHLIGGKKVEQPKNDQVQKIEKMIMLQEAHGENNEYSELQKVSEKMRTEEVTEPIGKQRIIYYLLQTKN